MSGDKKSVFLDVDKSICERNYLISKTSEEEEFDKFLHSSALAQTPSTTTKPSPGFCVKSHRKDSDKKVFINICQTEAIPAPRDISETELLAILDTDEICDFRVPMSIGSTRSEPDKKGEEATVCDIAVNTAFFAKVERIEAFKEFLIAVAFEGFQQKFDIPVANERIVLKKRKVIGTLQVHHIQQRDNNSSGDQKLRPIDEMLNNNKQINSVKSGITVIEDRPAIEPQYRLFTKKNEKTPKMLFGEFYMPYTTSGEDIELLIGEDRILLESIDGKYFLDTFHNYRVDRTECKSEFDKNSKFLTVTMPIDSDQQNSTVLL